MTRSTLLYGALDHAGSTSSGETTAPADGRVPATATFALAIGDKYRPTGGQFMEVEGTAASTPVDATAEQHAQEAKSADAWFAATTRETFG